jgi:hypothetical protein
MKLGIDGTDCLLHFRIYKDFFPVRWCLVPVGQNLFALKNYKLHVCVCVYLKIVRNKIHIKFTDNNKNQNCKHTKKCASVCPHSFGVFVCLLKFGEL